MRLYAMPFCFAGIIFRRLLPSAAGFLILLGFVRWNLYQSVNLNFHASWYLNENGSKMDPASVERLQVLCPPRPTGPVNAAGLGESPELNIVQQNNPCVRCAGRSANDGRWFNFSTRSGRFLAYSAIFDDRSGLGSSAVIRIIGVADPVQPGSLHCLLHHDDKRETGYEVRMMTPLEPHPMKIGSGWNLDGRDVTEYIFTCSAGNAVPYAVSIVEKEKSSGVEPESVKIEKWLRRRGAVKKTRLEPEKELTTEPNQSTVTASSSSPSSCMTVQVPVRPAKRDDFAVCVPVAYRSIDPYRLIEWMELQRILGVSLVSVAHVGLNRTSLRVLEHYVREGFLDLRRSEPLTLTPDVEHRRLHSTPTINDCILRLMHRFNWILVLDFDEFILPRRHSNIRGLVQYLDAKDAARVRKPATSYVFRNNYFFLDLEPDLTISPYLTVLRHREKVPVSGPGYSVKSMINPRACSRMHNHACWGKLPGYSEYASDVRVDIEDGLNQHYKKCHFHEVECQQVMQNVTRDDVMLRFKDELTSRVREKVKAIMGHDL